MPVGQIDAIQVTQDDLLDSPHVYEVEGQGTATRLIHTPGTVLLAQTLELLCLAELGPREGAREQGFHECADVFASLLGFPDQTVGIAPGIGRYLFGIVVVVGRAPARRLSLVGFDEFSAEVDAYELRVAPHPHCLSDMQCGYGVERLLEAHVMIGVDLVLSPERRVETLLLKGQ